MLAYKEMGQWSIPAFILLGVSSFVRPVRTIKADDVAWLIEMQLLSI